MDEILKAFSGIDLPLFFEKWMSAIMNPGRFLSQDFVPTDEQLADGLQFYLMVVAVSVLIYGLIAIFVERGSLAIKGRMLANGLLGMISFFVIAMVVHIPLWLLGGKAAFSGTLLTYIYAGTPYGPLVSVGQWVLVSGMPPRLRRYALNPSTAKEAGKIAAQDPETDKITFFAGCFIVLGFTGWAIFLTFRWLSFVHDLHGWRYAFAIILCVLISAPVGAIIKRMGSIPYDVHPVVDAVSDAGVGDT
jgi:hypothetical protein